MSERLSRKELLASYIYPVHCPYCKQAIHPDDVACPDCKSKLPDMTYSRFAIGGIPCVSALPYTGRYSKAAKLFKFGRRGSFARPFALLMLNAVKERYKLSDFDCVAFVPSRRRVLLRKFPHAWLLARELSQLADLPLEPMLEQFKKNKKQHTLKRSQREKNVRGVFRLTDKDAARGKRVLLVDDIITTGHTLGECARVLNRGKALDVRCVTLCTTIA